MATDAKVRERQPYRPTVAATNTEDLPVMLKLKQAARIANVSERGLLNLVREGEVKAVKVGTSWRIPRDAFLQQLGIAV